MPNPLNNDRPDAKADRDRNTRECWVERFLKAAAEPTCPESIDAQREALSMLFPEARVAGVSLVPPMKVGPDFPGSLGLLLVPDSLDVPETKLGSAVRALFDASEWPAYANGLMRAYLELDDLDAPCALVVARAIDRTTLLQAASDGL